MTEKKDKANVSDQRKSRRTGLRILLTLLPVRKKFLFAFGNLNVLDYFDLIIDATGVVAADGGTSIYEDEIIDERIVKISSASQAVDVLEKHQINDCDFCLVFRPRSDPESLKIIDVLAARSKKWAVLSNKVTLRDPLRLLNAYSYICLFSNYLKAYLSITTRSRRPDVFFTNSIVANMGMFRHFIPRRIVYVPHMDTRTDRNETSNKYRIGVFLDQYLPFHKELQYRHGVAPDAARYYSALGDFFAYAKERFCLDEIYFCRHPNSQGEELSYLRNCRPSYGNSYEHCATAQIVFSHYSNSLSFAQQLGKPIVLVRFENGLLPEVVDVAIEERARQLGADVLTLQDGVGSYHVRSSVLHSLRNWLNQKFVLRPDAEPFPVQLARLEGD